MMFPCGYPDLAKSFEAALLAQDLEKLKLTLYTLRHGGASTDAALGDRPLLAIQRRGQWRRDSSVRRYEKHARLSRVLWRVPAHVRDREVGAERELKRLWSMISTWRAEALTWTAPKSSSKSSRGRVR